MEALLIPERPRKNVIKRGLGALIPSNGVQRDLIHCPIDRIKPMVGQPRLAINPEGLKELAESIVAAGVLQPVLLRREQDYYRLVAGERRWRASRLAGLETIPALIKDMADDEAYALALIENVQREDLTPMEEALACRRLIDEYQFTQKQLAKKLGKARSTIANMLRLLDLPEPVQNYVSEGRLTPGHARAVLSVPEEKRKSFADRLIKQNKTVREAEAEAKICSASAAQEPVEEDSWRRRMDFLSQKLGVALQASVRIVPDGDGVRMEIDMENEQQLFAVASQLLYSSSAG